MVNPTATRGILVSTTIAVAGAILLGGCVYRTETVPAASPATTVVVSPPAATERIVTYPEGRYELRGNGSLNDPYYWVWIPSGASPPIPPPLPRITR